MSYILGISCFYHDSAICLLKDDEVVFALQEERLSRIKNDSSFPSLALKELLSVTKVTPREIDCVAYFEKPFIKLERICETFIATYPYSHHVFKQMMPTWFSKKLNIKKVLKENLVVCGITPKNFYFPTHHQSHAAFAYYTSPFKDAAICTLDGVGEKETLTLSHGTDTDITQLANLNFPHSLGLFYSSITQFCGFEVNKGEYKLMGLAPYGKEFVERTSEFKKKMIDNLIEIKTDGSFRLNLDFFSFHQDFTMFPKQKWEELFDLKMRTPTTPLTYEYASFAFSAQEIIQEVTLLILKNLKNKTRSENLCLSGGVALNCVNNTNLFKAQIFKNIYIPPAPGDAGSAIGAALSVRRLKDNGPHHQIELRGSLLGREFSEQEIKRAIEDHPSKHSLCSERLSDREHLTCDAAENLKADKIIGWFQGRGEFGPRSLGNRSILASPQGNHTQMKVNQAIKFREGFRPFAPSILSERFNEFYENDLNTPYMEFVNHSRSFVASEKLEKPEKHRHLHDLISFENIHSEKTTLPAVTHVDGSARVQSVFKTINPLFHQLITKFNQLSGVPILLNTSFNRNNEPIVYTPKDAIDCFLLTKLDILYLGNYKLTKKG